MYFKYSNQCPGAGSPDPLDPSRKSATNSMSFDLYALPAGCVAKIELKNKNLIGIDYYICTTQRQSVELAKRV